MLLKNRYFVIRHGHSENNELKVTNTHNFNIYKLTKLGEEQATNARIVVGQEKIDIVISSPFLRAKETAEIISNKAIQVIFDVRLKELEESAVDGSPLDNLVHRSHKVAIANWSRQLNKEETYESLYLRCKDLIDSVESLYASKNILLVTHGAPQNMIEAILKSKDALGTKLYFVNIVLQRENIWRKNCEVLSI